MADDLDILISRYLDGTASADEVDRLDGLIARDRRVAGEVYRAAYVDALLRDAMLPSTATIPAGADAAGNVADGPQAPQGPDAPEPIRLPINRISKAKPPQPLRTAEPTRRPRQIHPARFRRQWVWAAAACLVVGTFVGWRLMRPHGGSANPNIALVPAIPKVKAPGGASIYGKGGRHLAASDATLALNDELRTDTAEAMIAYDGEATRIIVKPQSGVAVLDESGKRFKLTTGRVDCQVEKQKPGQRLVIVTDQAEMTVVGTKFNVTTSQGWTRLQVLEGTVRARRLSDGATVDVSFDSTHGPEYVDVAHPGVRPPPAPNGMDMSKYWSTDIRPAGINQ